MQRKQNRQRTTPANNRGFFRINHGNDTGKIRERKETGENPANTNDSRVCGTAKEPRRDHGETTEDTQIKK